MLILAKLHLAESALMKRLGRKHLDESPQLSRLADKTLNFRAACHSQNPRNHDLLLTHRDQVDQRGKGHFDGQLLDSPKGHSIYPFNLLLFHYPLNFVRAGPGNEAVCQFPTHRRLYNYVIKFFKHFNSPQRQQVSSRKAE